MTTAENLSRSSQVIHGRQGVRAPLGLRAVGVLLGYALLWTGIVFALVLVIRFGFGAGDALTLNLIAGAIPLHGIGLIALILWRFRSHGERLSLLNRHPLGARTLHLLWQIPSMWVALLLSIAVMLPVLESFGDPSTGGAASTMDEVNAFMAVAVFAGVALVAPVWEELFFRGILYRGLRARRGVVIAVLLSALIFALAHAVALMVPYFFVMAVSFALIYEFHQNIWTPIAAHVLVNVPLSAGTLLTVL